MFLWQFLWQFYSPVKNIDKGHSFPKNFMISHESSRNSKYFYHALGWVTNVLTFSYQPRKVMLLRFTCCSSLLEFTQLCVGFYSNQNIWPCVTQSHCSCGCWYFDPFKHSDLHVFIFSKHISAPWVMMAMNTRHTVRTHCESIGLNHEHAHLYTFFFYT